MKKSIFTSFATASFLFVGCSSSTTTPTEDTLTPTEVTVVDGYIKDANVTDANSMQAVQVDGSKGLYRFPDTPTYPLSAAGGTIVDTNVTFDINMTSHEGLVISPITTFIEDDTTLKNNLLTTTGMSEEQLLGDYIENNTSDIAKVSQALYVMIKDTNATDTFKASISSTIPADTTALIDTALSSTTNLESKTLLTKTKNYTGTPGQIETYLEQTKKDIANDLFANGAIAHNGYSYKTVTSPGTGKVWLDRNLGATQVCTSKDDSSCYGTYFQYGSDGKSFIETENITDDYTTDITVQERQTYWNKSDSSSICPLGFRVPTKAELEAESLGNAEVSYASFLKLPATGAKLHNAQVQAAAANTTLWTNTIDTKTFYMWDGTYPQDVGNVVGLPVRCIEE